MIATVGSLVGGLGFYDTVSPGGWCQFESWCSSFGELSLVLWMICVAYFSYDQIRQLSEEPVEDPRTRQRRMFTIFHCIVWPISAILTIIPGALGAFGFRQESDHDFWCWFDNGLRGWELGQFYIPLCISTTASLLAFTYIVTAIIRITRQLRQLEQEANSSPEPELHGASDVVLSQRQQNQLFGKMALQLGALIIVFIPDACVYAATASGKDVPDAIAGISLFMWRSEGFVMALLWLINKRVQRGLAPIVSGPVAKVLRLCSPPSEEEVGGETPAGSGGSVAGGYELHTPLSRNSLN